MQEEAKSDLKQSEWSVNQLTNHVGGNPSQNSYYPQHEHTLCLQMNSTSTLISNVDLHLTLLIYWHLLYAVVNVFYITDLYLLLTAACPEFLFIIFVTKCLSCMCGWETFYVSCNVNDLEIRCSFTLSIIALSSRGKKTSCLLYAICRT